MTLKFTMNSTQNNLLFHTDENAIDSSRTCFEGYYVYQSFFDVYMVEELSDNCCDLKETKVAEIAATFVDENRCLNDGVDLFEAADIIDQDIASAFEILFYRSRKYKQVSEDAAAVPLVSCYLDRLYVLPEHRNKGIGTYLLDNLADIFEVHVNRCVRAIITYPAPFHMSEEVVNDADREKMLKTMKRHLKKAGYKEFGNTNYFIHACTVKK